MEVSIYDARNMDDMPDLYSENGIFEPLAKTFGKDDVIPCFFVTSYGSLFGKIERIVKGDHYAHAAMTFDSSMETLYTFNSPGFTIESIQTYLNRNEDYEIYIGAIFLTYREYERVRKWINTLIKNVDKSFYPFKNLINVIFDKPVKKRTQFSMICSEFVARVFKVAGISLSTRDLTITTPEDLRQTDNARVYMIYEGLARDYRAEKTNRIIGALKSRIKRGLRRDLIGEASEENNNSPFMDDCFMESIFGNDGDKKRQRERAWKKLYRKERQLFDMYATLRAYADGYISQDGYVINPQSFEELKENYFIPTPDQFRKAKGGYNWDFANYQNWLYMHAFRYKPENVGALTIVTNTGYIRTVSLLWVKHIVDAFDFLYIECNVKNLEGIWGGDMFECLCPTIVDIYKTLNERPFDFTVYFHREVPETIYGKDMDAYCRFALSGKPYLGKTHFDGKQLTTVDTKKKEKVSKLNVQNAMRTCKLN